jgi:CRISPR-associated protein Csx16
MTVWFVSRHAGALEWANAKRIAVDRRVAHLDLEEIRAGDTVIGALPVHLAAGVCERGARYVNLSVDSNLEDRGQELSVADLDRLGARLETFEVRRVS